MRRILVTAMLFCALGTCASADGPAYSPTESLYRSAIKAMGDLKEPPYVTYAMRGDPDGLSVGLNDINHLIWLNIYSGSNASLWQVRHRTDDYASELLLQNDVRYVSHRSFFDPTWYGAYRALRDGMLNYQVPEKAVSERATPPPDAPDTLHEIAVVNVMGPTIYSLQDRGEKACPNGKPGHALHLVSRNRDPKHQLSDVIIETESMRFCMMRFGVSDAFGFHGIVEQHYGLVGGYWMQTDGLLDGTERVFGISMHHGKWMYHLDNLTFPQSVPSEAFVAPFTQ